MTATQSDLVKQFMEHRDALLAFIFGLTHDFDVAEEVFQETAQVVFEEAGRGTAVVRFLPWAREVARRRVAEHWRKQYRRRLVEQASSALVEVIDLAFAENEQVLEDHRLRLKYLAECQGRLAGRSRQIVEGFYRDRKSIRHIAAALGWTENSVKVALSRARRALADCIRVRLAGAQRA